MAISIPSTVFTKYKEFADAMIADFGVNCKLVYTEQVEEISEDVPRVKQRRSMNIQDRNDAAGFARGSKKFKTVENTEDIKLRVYWNRKDSIIHGTFSGEILDLSSGNPSNVHGLYTGDVIKYLPIIIAHVSNIYTVYTQIHMPMYL